MKAQLGHPHEFRGGESAQLQDGSGAPCRQRPRHPQRGGGRFRLQGSEAQHRGRREVVSQVFQHGNRVQIGPVQILQYQHASMAGGDVGQQPQQRFTQLHGGRPVQRLARPAPFGHQLGEGGADDVEVGLLRWTAVAEPARQRLEQRPERHRGAGVDRTPGQDAEPALAGDLAQFSEQARLADARLARYEGQAAPVSLGLVERLAQILPLRHAPHQLRTHNDVFSTSFT